MESQSDLVPEGGGVDLQDISGMRVVCEPSGVPCAPLGVLCRCIQVRVTKLEVVCLVPIKFKGS